MRKIEPAVTKVLSNVPQSRSNDNLLIALVLKELNLPTDLEILANLTGVGICESITRARRRIQQLNPFLANVETKKRRKLKEEEIKQWIKN